MNGLADGTRVRTAVFRGREHLVVPVVALVGDAVVRPLNSLGREYVPAAALAHAPAGWNGRPIVTDHPDGGRSSANDPDVLERYAFGHVFNARYEGGSLKMEAWIDPERAAEMGGDALRVMERCLNGDMVEVSVGCYISAAKQPGISPRGEQYDYVWGDIIPDHLAMLPEGIEGACSVKYGCGAPRLMRAAPVAALAEWDESRHPREQDGRFSDAGGFGAVGEQVGTQHKDWQVRNYSFEAGKPVDAVHLFSFPAGKLGSILEAGFEDKAQLESIVRQRGVKAAPGGTILYRLGSEGSTELSGTNAANAEGLLVHIARSNQDLIAAGDTIHVFSVKLPERPGTYVRYRGRRAAAEWDESQHPREADGKFTDAGGGSGMTQVSIDRPDGFLEFKTKQAADLWGTETQGWAEDLTKDQAAALDRYTSVVGVNADLRRGRYPAPENYWHGEANKKDRYHPDNYGTVDVVKGLDEVFAKPEAELPMDVITHRAWDGRGPHKPEGTIFRDRGFVSTAMARPEISVFKRDNPGIAEVEIKVPAGTRALYLGHESGAPAGGERWFASSSELLLNRGTKFKVISTDYDKHTKRARRIQLEVVP